MYKRQRYLNAGDNYLPSLEMIPRLCSTLGNNILLRWLEAQVEAEENAVPPAQNRTEVLTSVVRAGAALGNVQRILAETQVIVPHNARKLRSALNDVITECRVAKESLQPLAARKDLAECTHISVSYTHLPSRAGYVSIPARKSAPGTMWTRR